MRLRNEVVLLVTVWCRSVTSFSFASKNLVPKRGQSMATTIHSMTKLTPSEIDELVVARDQFRAVMNYAQADKIKALLEENNIEIADISYKCIGNSQWTYKTEIIQDVNTNLMELAHESYDMITEMHQSVDIITTKAKDALRLQLFRGRRADSLAGSAHDITCAEPVVVFRSTEMQGRKYADAAFEFSMAGISDSELYELLADCSLEELQRFGLRRSCKPIHIVQMVEKLAAAGVRGHPVYSTASDILQRKYDEASSGVKWRLESVRDYDLFSGRVLMWLWRYATKQTKPTKKSEMKTDDVGATSAMLEEVKQTTSALSNELSISGEITTVAGACSPLPTFESLFADPTLPLVLDLGCGYGVSLLSLCDQSARQKYGRRFNFLGADLSNRAIRYASGITSRWGYSNTCAFLYCDCLHILQYIRDSYPGPVAFVMVNFPTPYSVSAVLRHQSPAASGASTELGTTEKDTDGQDETALLDTPGSLPDIVDDTKASPAGNTQLPDSFDNFMFNAGMVRLIQEVFTAKPCPGAGAQALLLQSNVEDVVVTMRNIVLQAPQAVSELGLPPKFIIPEEADLLNSTFQNLFLTEEQGGEVTGATQPLRWRSRSELEASTDVSRGGGRMSKRLETWLADLRADLSGEESGDQEARTGVAARARAFGHGWLASSPLPGNARTETEVHCEVEKQPVHRTMFMFR